MKTSALALAVSVATLFSSAFGAAIPTELSARSEDVASNSTSIKAALTPQIYSPSAGTIWTIGSTQAVEWDISSSSSGAEAQGKIVLAKNFQMLTSEVGGLDNPLAVDFSIFDGVAHVTVPYVDPGYEYQIVLFGDSGHYSPTFTISY